VIDLRPIHHVPREMIGHRAAGDLRPVQEVGGHLRRDLVIGGQVVDLVDLLLR